MEDRVSRKVGLTVKGRYLILDETFFDLLAKQTR